MAGQLNIITNGSNGGLPVQNAGLKLSKIIAVERIEEHGRFKEPCSIDEDLLERIASDMRLNKFDSSQPVHIWVCKDGGGTEHFYLIDGYTRLEAAKLAGLPTVPYFEHNFSSFEEAHRYALHLQVDRRNLGGAELLKNIEVLMGSGGIQNLKENKNAAIGEMLGVSEKTVERAKFVEKNATDEQLEAIGQGVATVNSTFEEIKKERKRASRQTTTEDEADDDSDENGDSDENDDSESGFDDFSESLSDGKGNPAALNFLHSDGIERPDYRPSAEEDSERARERRAAYEKGYLDGLEKGCNLAREICEYILGGIECSL